MRDRNRSLLLAAEAAQLAQNLPDGAAVSVTITIAVHEKHLADLLLEFVSRGQLDSNKFVTFSQAVIYGNSYMTIMTHSLYKYHLIQ